MTPHDCVLAIVGSRDVPRYAAESFISTAILEHHPRLIVSGGARGIDTLARETGQKLNIPVIEVVPTIYIWDHDGGKAVATEKATEYGIHITVPGGFKQRNQVIVEMCTCLERMYSRTTETYGSGWTADRAESLGKHVVQHLIG